MKCKYCNEPAMCNPTGQLLCYDHYYGFLPEHMNEKRDWTREELEQAISDNLEGGFKQHLLGEWEDKLEVEAGRKIMEARSQEELDAFREALRNEVDRRGLRSVTGDELMPKEPYKTQIPWNIKLPTHPPLSGVFPIKAGFPKDLTDNLVEVRPIDLTDAAKAFDFLKEHFERTGRAVDDLSESLADLLELSDEELRVAKAYEDVIEEILEAKYNRERPKDPIDVTLDPAPDARIAQWLQDRYPSWTLVFDGSNVRFCPND